MKESFWKLKSQRRCLRYHTITLCIRIPFYKNPKAKNIPICKNRLGVAHNIVHLLLNSESHENTVHSIHKASFL